MCPSAAAQIQTSLHAGGMTSERMRFSVSGVAIRLPFASK
jgi:hypothetical protein